LHVPELLHAIEQLPPAHSKLHVPVPLHWASQFPSSHSKLQVPEELHTNVQSVPVHFSVQVADDPQMQVAPALHWLTATPGPQAASVSVNRESTAKIVAIVRISLSQ
jgi:hypothetical protein